MKRGIVLLMLLSLIISVNAEAQKNRSKNLVSGQVTDVNGRPVAGAMILTDRHQTDVYTNRKGFYKIRINPAVKMIGVYSDKKGSAETELYDNKDINFVLSGTFAFRDIVPSQDPGDEMINIGYGKVRKKDLTTSPGKIDATQDKYASYTNIYDMISGEVPGVQVVDGHILIRGIHSVNMSNDPLFVVDGMIVSSIDHISPKEVKTITVLKGSDASIYGTRGAGGVILIDLKGASDK
jgi:hypothetical protein